MENEELRQRHEAQRSGGDEIAELRAQLERARRDAAEAAESAARDKELAARRHELTVSSMCADFEKRSAEFSEALVALEAQVEQATGVAEGQRREAVVTRAKQEAMLDAFEALLAHDNETAEADLPAALRERVEALLRDGRDVAVERKRARLDTAHERMDAQKAAATRNMAQLSKIYDDWSTAANM